MKRIFLFIIVLLLFPLLTHGAYLYDSKDVGFFSSLKENTSVLSDKNKKSVTNVLSNPNDNLYERIYENYKNLPKDNALKSLNIQSNIDEDDLEEILFHGNFKLLTDYCGGPSVIKTELISCREVLLESYEKEKELAELQYSLEEKISATEIWANSSLSDSSFDLIVDLNIIDVILFGDEADMLTAPFADNENEDEESDEDDIIQVNPLVKDALEGFGTSDKDKDKENEDSDTISDEICIDPALVNAKENLSAKVKEGGTEVLLPRKSLPSEQGEFLPPFGDTFSNLPSETDGIDGCEGRPVMGGLFCLEEREICSAVNEKEDGVDFALDFKVCISIDFKVTEKSIYKKSANCVDCHISTIVEEMKEFLGSDFRPARNTQHAYEISHENHIMSGFGLNVYYQTKPMFPQTKDPHANSKNEKGEDKYSVKTDHDTYINKLMEKMNQYEKDYNLLNAEDADLSKIWKKRLNSIQGGDWGVGSNLSDATETVSDQLKAVLDTREEIFDSWVLASRISNKQRYWEVIKPKFLQMNNLFKSFQEQFSYMGIEIAEKIKCKTKECRERENNMYCKSTFRTEK